MTICLAFIAQSGIFYGCDGRVCQVDSKNKKNIVNILMDEEDKFHKINEQLAIGYSSTYAWPNQVLNHFKRENDKRSITIENFNQEFRRFLKNNGLIADR